MYEKWQRNYEYENNSSVEAVVLEFDKGNFSASLVDVI